MQQTSVPAEYSPAYPGDHELPDFNDYMLQTSLPVMVLDRNLVFIFTNEAYRQAVGRTQEQLIGHFMFDVFQVDNDRREMITTQLNRTFAGESVKLANQTLSVPDASGLPQTRYWQAIHEPLRDTSGDIRFLVQVSEDVTEQTLLRHQKDVISAELDHRMKNFSSIILAVASMSKASATSVDQYADDFSDRLHAMVRTYQALSDNGWTGLTLRQVLLSEIQGTCGQCMDQCKIEGDDFKFSLQASKNAGLILHELVSNAVKHGCFSTPGGHLSVTWRIADGFLHVDWLESGLAGLKEPTHEGFGTTVFLIMTPMKVSRRFLPTGLHLTMSIPLDIVLHDFDDSART